MPTDDLSASDVPTHADAVAAALTGAFLSLDVSLRAAGAAARGGCSVCVAVQAGRLLSVANVGSSARAVLDTGSYVMQLSTDHSLAELEQQEHARLRAGELVVSLGCACAVHALVCIAQAWHGVRTTPVCAHLSPCLAPPTPRRTCMHARCDKRCAPRDCSRMRPPHSLPTDVQCGRKWRGNGLTSVAPLALASRHAARCACGLVAAPRAAAWATARAAPTCYPSPPSTR